ncbi:hypothetical protein KCP74_10740 [Salmonella enterica subsp. enterica]|nr:hypothetical protein KCP74_10740 [Salmonella enterica subsp. enterica]
MSLSPSDSQVPVLLAATYPAQAECGSPPAASTSSISGSIFRQLRTG